MALSYSKSRCRAAARFDRSQLADDVRGSMPAGRPMAVYRAKNLEDAVVELLQDRKSLIGETVGSPGWRRREGRS